jgi:methionyl-tRNA synthetase
LQSREAALKDYALIEFEETVLSPQIPRTSEEILRLAESLIVKFSLSTEPPSPAEIVLFSTLYSIAPSAKLDTNLALSAWFTRVTGTAWAKAGVEKATALTTVKPVTISKGAQGSKSLPRKPDVKKIKEGIAMKIPKLGEAMFVVLLGPIASSYS